MKNYKYPIYPMRSINNYPPIMREGGFTIISTINELKTVLIKLNTNSFECFDIPLCIRYNYKKNNSRIDDEFYTISKDKGYGRKKYSPSFVISHTLLVNLYYLGAAEKPIKYGHDESIIQFNKKLSFDKNLESEIKLLNCTNI